MSGRVTVGGSKNAALPIMAAAIAADGPTVLENVPDLVDVATLVSLLRDLGLDKSKETRLYHVPYNNIKMWSDMVTSPGVMAAFSKSEIESGVAASSPLRLTLVCDNIRTPDNLGAVFRCAAAAGAKKVVTTRWELASLTWKIN